MANWLFADRLEHYGPSPAVVTDDGKQWTYAALAQAADTAASALQGAPALVVVEAANELACVVAYLACLRKRFPVLLAEPGSTKRDARIADTFRPAYVFRQDEQSVWRFERFAADAAPVHPDLCVLLSTSGSTGSPKLVRLSRSNIAENAAAIADYLGIRASDRALTSLPPFYSYGMSVINSHLALGACLLLTGHSVGQDEFWQLAEREQATTLAGVPFTYDILERTGFRSRRYPHLRVLTQAGGRMAAERVRLYAEWAASQDKQFFVMYGQTEAAPRMAYVPPALLADNADAIGQPIPGGRFELRDSDGSAIAEAGKAGELVYHGPNVMMGYAHAAADLALDKQVHELRTGDLAVRKANGLYAIVGRMSRFSKLLGLRISLDEIERGLEQRGIRAAVSGDDELLAIAITQQALAPAIRQDVLQRFGLPERAVEVVVLEQLPVLPSGKTDFGAVLRLAQQQSARQRTPQPRSLQEGYAAILGLATVRQDKSFLDLGGDSVCFVEVSLLVEDYLGHLPQNWEAMPISRLEALHAAAGAPPPGAPPRHFRYAALVAIGLLLAGEAALQVRSYLKTGRSAMALVSGESTVVFNPDWQVSTYRPNHSIALDDGRIDLSTNSLGLRSAEIPRLPAPGELRVLVAGASTVVGAYAMRNSETFPSLLEAQLRSERGGVINVINGGIEGHTLQDTVRMLERGLLALRPSIVVLYPSLNNMVSMCRAPGAAPAAPPQPAPAPELPTWVLSRELIVKNTRTWLAPVRSAQIIDPATRFTPEYAKVLRQLVRMLRASGAQPVLMTVARAFHGMQREEGLKLAASALYYNDCLDYEGLIKAVDLYNGAIMDVARQTGVPLLDLAAQMPGGTQYFKDAGHFTLAGRQYVASFLARELTQRGLLQAPRLSNR